MKKILSSIVFAILVCSPSFAQISAGISLSEQGFYALGTETNRPGSNNTPGPLTSEAGAFQDTVTSVFVEYDTGSYIIGIDYIPDTIQTPENKNDQPDGANTVKGEFENHLSIYGIVPTPLSGIYVKAGLGMVTLDSITTGITSKYGEQDTTFVQLGLGFQHDADNGVFLRAELAAMAYDDVEATATTGSQNAASENQTNNKVKLEDMLSAYGKISIGKTF